MSPSVCSCSSVSPVGKGISWPQNRWVLPGPRRWTVASGWARQWWWEGRGVGVAAVLWLVNLALLPVGGAALECSSGKTPRVLVG